MADSQTQQARFFVPEWWVNAYQCALGINASISPSSGLGSRYEFSASSIMPGLESQELNFLAHVIGDFQSQILSGQGVTSTGANTSKSGQATIRLRPEALSRHLGTTSAASRTLLNRLVQVIPGLRLMMPPAKATTESIHASDEAIFPQRLFSEESWRDVDGQIEGCLDLSEMGAEAFLGYSGSHSSLVGRLGNSRNRIDYKNVAPPLVLWRSIWLELGAQEQAVLLRMEKAIQWDFRWLHLDGVFSERLDDLCRGLKMPGGRSRSSGLAGAVAENSDGSEGAGELGRRLRMLAKIGRKLLEHGWLAPSGEQSFLAVTGSPSSSVSSSVTSSPELKSEFFAAHDLSLNSSFPDLVWRVSPQRLNMTELQEYRERVAVWLREVRWPQCAPVWTDYLKFISTGLRQPEMPKLKAEEPVKNLPGLLLGPAEIIDVQALFLEWRVRQEAGCKFPLPQDLVASRGAELCAASKSKTSESEMDTALVRFEHWLSENQDMVSLLRDMPMATLASAASLASSDLSENIRGFQSQVLVTSRNKPEELSRSFVSSSVLSAGKGAPVPAEINSAASNVSAVSQAQVMASRMRRVAAEELQRIKEGQQEQYRDLRAAFVQSLDEASRKVFAEVQSRMEPRVFDEHLRQRLVKFMVDNPAAWRSTSATPSKSSTLPPRAAVPLPPGQSGQRH